MNKKQMAIMITSTMFAMAAGSAGAGTATSEFTVQTTVIPACTIGTTGVIFDDYDPASTAALYASGSVAVTCVKGTAPTVGLNMGTSTERKMKGTDTSNASVLAYELFKPVAGTTSCTKNESEIWGSDDAALALGVAEDISARTFSVCGKLDAGQDVAPDTYTDSITATVNF